ncbi:hypothetical protein AHF37_04431 [Paragonimus kellicotti]|nr:hypothetical protein AHF37_04431 [Paragonimus kellicotti]
MIIGVGPLIKKVIWLEQIPIVMDYFLFPAIDQERKEKQLLDEITQPPPLKHTETEVKNPLPTKEDIAMEKSVR